MVGIIIQVYSEVQLNTLNPGDYWMFAMENFAFSGKDHKIPKNFMIQLLYNLCFITKG